MLFRSRSPQGERGLKFSCPGGVEDGKESLPSGGAWIEMPCTFTSSFLRPSSLPSGGAWIEMIACRITTYVISGRSPQGERGLKFLKIDCLRLLPCRSPQGERGLKWISRPTPSHPNSSLPSGGAWIEMAPRRITTYVISVAPLRGSVD